MWRSEEKTQLAQTIRKLTIQTPLFQRKQVSVCKACVWSTSHQADASGSLCPLTLGHALRICVNKRIKTSLLICIYCSDYTSRLAKVRMLKWPLDTLKVWVNLFWNQLTIEEIHSCDELFPPQGRWAHYLSGESSPVKLSVQCQRVKVQRTEAMST